MARIGRSWVWLAVGALAIACAFLLTEPWKAPTAQLAVTATEDSLREQDELLTPGPLPIADAPPRRAISAELPPTHNDSNAALISEPTGTTDTRPLRGRVLALEGRTPVVGASVRLLSTEWDPTIEELVAHVHATARTDAEGAFDLGALPAGAEVGRVEAEGCAPESFDPDRALAEGEGPLVLWLTQGAILRGTVSGATPAELTEMRILLSDYCVRWEIALQADGTWQAEHLPHVILASLLSGKQVLREENVWLPPGTVEQIAWELGAAATITGSLQIAETGEVLAEQCVWLEEDSGFECFSKDRKARTTVWSDAQGHFAFTDVAAGEWRVGPSPSNRRIVPLSTRVVVGADSHEIHVDLEVPLALSIRGVLLDPRGQPVAAGVSAAHRERAVYADATSKEDGTFVLDGLLQGPHEVRGDVYSDDLPFLASPDPVYVEAGAENVILVCKDAGSVAGRVLDGTTGAAVGAGIVFYCLEAHESIDAYDSEGEFCFPGLLPGAWEIWASHGELAGRARVEIRAGVSLNDVEVRLERGAGLSIRNASTKEYIDAAVQLGANRYDILSVAPGCTDRAALPPGFVRVVLTSWKDGATRAVLAEHELQLTGGQEYDIVHPTSPGSE